MKSLESTILYPDLFQPAGISFDLPESALLMVTVIDAADRIVFVPVATQRFEAGRHEILFSLPSRVDGALYYRITAQTTNETITETKRLH